MRRRISRRGSRSQKRSKSEAVVDVRAIMKEGYLSIQKQDKAPFNFDLLPNRKKYWYVLSGTNLFAIQSQPKDEEDYTKVVSVIDLVTVKEIKVEGALIIFEMNSKRNRRKVNAAGYDPRKIVSERKDGKAHVLRAQSNDEALKWVQAIRSDGQLDASRRNLDISTSNGLFSEEAPKPNNLTVSRLVVKDMRTRAVIFRTEQGLSGGAVPVKLLVGNLPPEFRIEVTVTDPDGKEVDGNSEVFYMDELIDLDGDRDAYEDRNISLNFEINGGNSEIRVYLQLARENLAKYELVSFQNRAERLFLEKVLFNIPQPYLSLVFFAILFLLLLPILKPFESFLFTLPTTLGLYPYVPKLEDFLLNRLQPYFVAHVSLKTREELEAARIARNKESKREPDESITMEELALLDELRTNLQPLLENVPNGSFAHEVLDKYVNYDFRLVRFVRARNGDLAKAAAMCEKAIKWRIEYEADNIVEDSKDGESFIPEWLLTYAGAPQVSEMLMKGSKILPIDRCDWFLRDKDSGNLAVLVRTGGNNWRQIYRKLGDNAQDVLFSYLIYVVQWLRESMDAMHMESNGKYASYLTFIVDLKGMKSSNQIPPGQLIALARRFLPIFFTCYPELLHRVLVINAPTVFYTLFSMVKPFIPKRVLQKFMIHGSSKNLDKLTKVLDKSDIPKSYGGDMVVNGDELCLDRIPSWGPFQPDKGKSLIE